MKNFVKFYESTHVVSKPGYIGNEGEKTYPFFPPLAFFLKIFVSCARNISRMYSKVKKYARKNVVSFIW